MALAVGTRCLFVPPSRIPVALLVATTLASVSATSTSGFVSAVVTPAPTVLVTDQYGNPMVGVTVTFTVTGGGGSVAPGSAVTDGSGRASTVWTLGPGAGSNNNTLSVSA